MSASARVLDDLRRGRRAMRFLGASGQLGYGIPTPALEAGLARRPDMIGCDMGLIDIGPTYLGKGEMATAPAATRRDLRKVLLGARRLDIPLVIGSAGSAGAAPHLEATLAMIRDIARADGLSFRMGVLRADIPRPLLKDALRSGKVLGLDGMPALSERDVDEAAHIVGQMGTSAFRRACAPRAAEPAEKSFRASRLSPGLAPVDQHPGPGPCKRPKGGAGGRTRMGTLITALFAREGWRHAASGSRPGHSQQERRPAPADAGHHVRLRRRVRARRAIAGAFR